MSRTSPRAFATVLAATAGLAVASAAGVPIGSASAAAPSSRGIGDGWTKLTASGQSNTAQISMARGRDGVLHVLWLTGGAVGAYRIWDTPVRARGTVGARVPATPLLHAPGPPAVVTTPHGIDAFWTDENSDIYQASRPASGGTWNADLADPVLTDPYADTISAAVAVDGSPWIAFADANDCGGFCVDRVGSSQVRLKVGGGCCLSSTALAVDGLRRTLWLAYVADRGARNTGLYVQKLTSAGTAASAAVRLPDTSGIFSLDQRMTVTGRGNGRPGVFAAYTGATHGTRPCVVHVLRLGAAKARNLGSNPACSTGPTYIAADPNGRLWVLWGVWSFQTGTATLYYRRSNPAATAWGPLEHVSFPRNLTIWSVYGSAQAGRIDVAALVSPGYEYVTRQVIVRLGLSARVSGSIVTFRVTDQGTPVDGSTIKFCGRSKATSASGRASFTIRPRSQGRASATASKASYQAARLTIKATC